MRRLTASVFISELPVGTWTDDYKAYLEKEIENPKKIIKEYGHEHRQDGFVYSEVS